MFAVIQTGGKQYKVTPGQKLKIEKLPKTEKEGAMTFEHVLVRADGDKVTIGTPYIKGSSVQAKVLGEGRGDKKLVFRYHSKTRYRKKKGHRQPFTEVEITKV